MNTDTMSLYIHVYTCMCTSVKNVPDTYSGRIHSMKLEVHSLQLTGRCVLGDTGIYIYIIYNYIYIYMYMLMRDE